MSEHPLYPSPFQAKVLGSNRGGYPGSSVNADLQLRDSAGLSPASPEMTRLTRAPLSAPYVVVNANVPAAPAARQPRRRRRLGLASAALATRRPRSPESTPSTGRGFFGRKLVIS